MMFDARLRVVQEATDVVLRRLAGFPSSTTTEQLRVWAEECQRELEYWGASAPTPRERDTMAKRLLALHVEVTRLERDGVDG